MKTNPHMRSLYTSAAQQTCISVGEAFKGYKELLTCYYKGELADKPKLPKYRKRGLFQISYPKRWLKLIDQNVRVPLGKSCKAWFGLSETFIPFPSNLNWNTIKELSIVPRAGYFDAVWVTKTEAKRAPKLTERTADMRSGIPLWDSPTGDGGSSNAFELPCA